MRLRKKWWARPELESSYLFINDPGSLKGNWKEEFNNNNSIYLELGCGRGGFISQAAQKYEDKNFLGIDLKDEVLIYALKKIEESQVENARITALNIAFVSELFNNNDNIERIYINFCNPWPKDRHNKRRLTHPKFLTYYKSFIKKGTQIWFKTDDEGLFMDSIDYFNESGFRIKYLTYDLANSGFEENIITEYENKFRNLGMNIMFLIAELE